MVTAFLKISKRHLYVPKNSEKESLSVDNVELYQHAKFQLKICCILGYTDITNPTNFDVLNMDNVHHA
jgi:hypothetical protein